MSKTWVDGFVVAADLALLGHLFVAGLYLKLAIHSHNTLGIALCSVGVLVALGALGFVNWLIYRFFREAK